MNYIDRTLHDPDLTVRQTIRGPDGLVYRLGVIFPIVNYAGSVLMGMPKKCPDTFTFTQGGANLDLETMSIEVPAETVGREAGEEVGLSIPGNADLIAVHTELMFEKFDEPRTTGPHSAKDQLSAKYDGKATYAAAYLLRPDAQEDIRHSDAFSLVKWGSWNNAPYLTGKGHYLRAYKRLGPTLGLIPEILKEMSVDMSHLERLEQVRSKLWARRPPNLGFELPAEFPRNDDYKQAYRTEPARSPYAKVPALGL